MIFRLIILCIPIAFTGCGGPCGSDISPENIRSFDSFEAFDYGNDTTVVIRFESPDDTATIELNLAIDSFYYLKERVDRCQIYYVGNKSYIFDDSTKWWIYEQRYKALTDSVFYLLLMPGAQEVKMGKIRGIEESLPFTDKEGAEFSASFDDDDRINRLEWQNSQKRIEFEYD